MVRDMLGRDCSTPDEIQGERRVENNRLVLLALKVRKTAPELIFLPLVSLKGAIKYHSS